MDSNFENLIVVVNHTMIVEGHLIYHINKLGLHIVLHFKWEWNDEKNVLILWKLISIQMKILNDIACNLHWIELCSHLIELKQNQICCMEFKSHCIELNSNSFEYKWNANWWTIYWKYANHFHHLGLWCWKKANSWKSHIWKDTFPFHSKCIPNQNLFW